MFQALYADLARAHRARREREFLLQCERRAQRERHEQRREDRELLVAPRMMAR